MHNHTYFEERVDKLAMLYMEKHYDISTMSVDEFVKAFNKTCNEIIDSIESSNNS
ncbi:hypothetical protein CPAST_c40360 [Clostridium pasteurianum DSM 525 = ATCC 6013]|uniref:Uncharacterized protein n=1 Tax=Clostridium pasteurianum DSM 525 = ATCC 6013 TaxID=1262449 RepID=A0A0H3JBP0_CLOPA|nr:hypothetical protein [Clostridium pasteurianum]AJA50065.1 hypothetical protein CPAST_c40360 [Clostridium pasteurianum DSM 525 = ATCC 6013]AJA54053.1 hypothetical protein CLPA_c40360 [Clostridium pasteurianum DSM 525 = ATCC 6013]ELP59230.1 hypothetical protein F502_10128 [Clostridium pasteurianum DSM 525 = ATCC 6013]KRU13922.1 hypothetical protein CP6013_03178 [Clostridium pasteurianum DSM 525 = ATCC 6013]